MNASVVSVLASTAVGQPLSSSMGIIGTLIAGGIIAMISYNAVSSPIGLYLLVGWTLLIVTLDHTRFSPTAAVINLQIDEINTALSWSLFRFAMVAIFFAAALTMHWLRWAGQPTAHSEARLASSLIRSESHLRMRSAMATSAIIMTGMAGFLYMYSAPRNSVNVAWMGIMGMQEGHTSHLWASLLAGVALSSIVLMCRWTTLGPLAGIIGIMMIPTYIVLPMWASLTGLVVTPGASIGTSIQMASPVMMALGTCLLGSVIGPIHLRHRLRHELGLQY